MHFFILIEGLQNGVASDSEADEKFEPKQSSSRKQAWTESRISDSGKQEVCVHKQST